MTKEKQKAKKKQKQLTTAKTLGQVPSVENSRQNMVVLDQAPLVMKKENIQIAGVNRTS